MSGIRIFFTQRWILFLAVAAVVGALAAYLLASPVGGLAYVMLTWRNTDTATTMTVLYQTQDDPGASRVLYDTRSRDGALADYRFEAQGTRQEFRQRERYIHTVELTGLVPATRYFFVIADQLGVRGKEYSFRTLSDDGSPVRVVAGGDMDTTRTAARVSRQAALLDPDVVIIGGDIAYAEGRMSKAVKWDDWMDTWCRLMVTGDGRLIPFIAAIGNHDVKNDTAGEPVLRRAPFFLGYLSQDNDHYSYFARNLGGNARLVVLDTDHLHPSTGAQTNWLATTLSEFRQNRYRFAVYHQPLYPGGVYPDVPAGENHKLVELWGRLFDRYRLTAALENHYHVHKRTWPLRGNKVVSEGSGTVYLGGGAWGTEPRSVNPGLWYLASTHSRNHFWVMDISADKVEYRAIDEDGEIFDQGISYPPSTSATDLNAVPDPPRN